MEAVVGNVGSRNFRVGWGSGALPEHVLGRNNEDEPWPVTRGLVTDWEAYQSQWQHVFDDVLDVPSEEHPVIVADSITTPEAARQKTAEILFERFKVPGMLHH